MATPQPPSKWIKGLSPDGPLGEAARRALSVRLPAVCDQLEDARQDPSERTVHQLRVATRRAGAALKAFDRVLGDRDAVAKTRKVLKRVRRAAATVRLIDVHDEMLAGLAEGASEARVGAIGFARGALARERIGANAALERAASKVSGEALRVLFDQVTASATAQDGLSVRAGAGLALDEALDGLLEAGRADLAPIENLHAIRLAAKRVRYASEVFAGSLGDDFRSTLYAELTAMQDRLGEVNDLHELSDRLAGLDPPKAHRSALKRLVKTLRGRLDRAADAFRGWWSADRSDSLVADFRARLLSSADGGSVSLRLEDRGVGEGDGAARGEGPLTSMERALDDAFEEAERLAQTNGASHPHRESVPAPRQPVPADARRLAAIDVGTNSIRLVITEATPDGRYRIIDDEKAVTRLGLGLDRTGLMREDKIEASADAIARMIGLARGYSCAMIRIIATSAAREARNTDLLVDRVRELTGAEVEVISAQEEARLALRSVQQAFDLTSTRAAVVDIGGGSTEIILTANGLIEQVYPLRLGAVRLTDRFGTCEPGRDDRYDEMRDAIMGALREHMGKPPFTPQQMFGTGGTFTNLASMTMLAGARPDDPTDALPFSVRGCQAMRSDVRHTLEALRKLTVRERAGVAGLSPDRAPIIVAGLAIAECVMKRLGVNMLRVHDRGIREGLILEMADEAFPGAGQSLPSPKDDRFASAERFAARCHYEQAHAHHVSFLATRIFDQLVEGLDPGDAEWASPESRELLRIGSLLHDVGYVVNYSKHHKHSYHLIRHADIPGLDVRETEIVANLARYHRKAEPKASHPNLARLSPEDRELVSRLASVARLADGLARSHSQIVEDLTLTIEGKVATFSVVAGQDPAVDIWGAQRKSGLFERVFSLTPSFRWSRNGPREERRPASTTEPRLTPDN